MKLYEVRVYATKEVAANTKREAAKIVREQLKPQGFTHIQPYVWPVMIQVQVEVDEQP